MGTKTSKILNLNTLSGQEDIGLRQQGFRSDIVEQFHEIIDNAIVADNKTRPKRSYIGGSSLGDDCVRKIQYRFMGVEPDKEKEFTAKTLRIFEFGHNIAERFSEDGAIQVRPQGAPANFLEEVDTLRVVEGNSRELEKGNDGLFRPVPGQTVDTSANVKVLSGALEMSNVNPVHEMVDMINHQRQFELQVKLMKTAEEIDERQDQLMRIV